MKYCLIYLLIGIALLSCAKEKKDLVHDYTPKVNVVAHRGLHFDSIAPENSLDAVYLAKRVGYTAVEIDLNLTADKKIVVFHDDTINSTLRFRNGYKSLGEDVAIIDIPFENLRSDYVFASKNEGMRRPVATLGETLQLCKQLNLYPYIEIKIPNFAGEFDLVVEIVETATKILGKNNFAITSFDFTLIGFLRKTYPDLDLYCDSVNHLKGLVDHRLHYFPQWEALRQDFIDMQHKEGRQVATWTVAKDEFDIVSNLNVDAILSDEVAPDFDQSKALYSNYSNSAFSHYNSTGSVVGGVVRLNKGETISLKSLNFSEIYLGGIYFHIDARGKFRIEATNFVSERENKSLDYKLYKFQYLMHNETPSSFTITALEDGVEIKDLWFAVTEF